MKPVAALKATTDATKGPGGTIVVAASASEEEEIDDEEPSIDQDPAMDQDGAPPPPTSEVNANKKSVTAEVEIKSKLSGSQRRLVWA